jgi:hypothetical protein
LNEHIAFIYRAYSTLDWPVKITSPSREAAKDEVFDAGSAVTIKVDDSKFAGWTKLELYDGATKVGELTKGRAEFSVKNLKAGFHAFSILGTDYKGTIRPSNPVLIVVRKLPGSTKEVPAPLEPEQSCRRTGRSSPPRVRQQEPGGVPPPARKGP